MKKNKKSISIIEKRGKRINLNVRLSTISKRICDAYGFGKYESNDLITKGFEDFNYILHAGDKKYFVKIFNKKKTRKVCLNIVDRMDKARQGNVNVPNIYEFENEKLYEITLKGVNYRLCVIEYIEKKLESETKSTFNKNELKKVIKQITNLHSIDYIPQYIKSSGGVLDFENMYTKCNKYLNRKNKKVVKSVYEQFKKINIEKLPHVFAHGDVGAGNIIKSNNGKIYLIDLGLSNYYPRIVDLAQMIVNMCLVPDNIEKTSDKIQFLVNEYEKHITLTQYEKKTLKLLYKVTICIYMLFTAFLLYKSKEKTENIWIDNGIELLEYYN